MKEGNVIVGLGADLYESYKYLIQKQSDGQLTLKQGRFKRLIVNNFDAYKKINEDYITIMHKIVV